MSIKSGLINGVATIEIARPEKKNALTIAMYEDMAVALQAAADNPSVRAALITGQPGIFTSGNDIEDFMSRPPGQGSNAESSPVFRFLHALATFESRPWRQSRARPSAWAPRCCCTATSSTPATTRCSRCPS